MIKINDLISGLRVDNTDNSISIEPINIVTFTDFDSIINVKTITKEGIFGFNKFVLSSLKSDVIFIKYSTEEGVIYIRTFVSTLLSSLLNVKTYKENTDDAYNVLSFNIFDIADGAFYHLTSKEEKSITIDIPFNDHTYNFEQLKEVATNDLLVSGININDIKDIDLVLKVRVTSQ